MNLRRLARRTKRRLQFRRWVPIKHPLLGRTRFIPMPLTTLFSKVGMR